MRAKALVARLKDELQRQQFAIAIQAAVGGKILGRIFVFFVAFFAPLPPLRGQPAVAVPTLLAPQ